MKEEKSEEIKYFQEKKKGKWSFRWKKKKVKK